MAVSEAERTVADLRMADLVAAQTAAWRRQRGEWPGDPGTQGRRRSQDRRCARAEAPGLRRVRGRRRRQQRRHVRDQARRLPAARPSRDRTQRTASGSIWPGRDAPHTTFTEAELPGVLPA